MTDRARPRDALPSPSYTEASPGQDGLGREYLVTGTDALHAVDNPMRADAFRW